ncbi:MAG: peptidylprolyl isomerase [Thiotrichales bacterium]|nr:peptidylprolyl isomerase [Thiotrichales bacterium]
MKQRYLAAILCVVLTGSQNAMAFSLLEWLGLRDDPAQQARPEATADSEQATAPANWAESSSETVVAAEPAAAVSGNDAVSFDDIKLIIANLNQDQRDKLLSDEAAFSSFIRQQAANQSVLAAAYANRLEQEPLTRMLMQKTAQSTLREIYIKRLISKELPADFPNEEQARVFYENNSDKFGLPERVHLWQIFLPFDKDGDAKHRDAIKKQAVDLKKRIDGKKISFEQAATEHSRHIPSRHAGGYMGLIKLTDIKPEISTTVLELQEGKLSQPLLSDDGYHLIRRGTRIAASVLSFEQVRNRINQALRQEAEKRLRQAIYDQAGKTYDRRPDDKRIEEWRLKLRTNL